MVRSPALLLLLTLTSAPGQEPARHDLFSLEDLIAASGGHLAVHATLPDGSREVALNDHVARPSDFPARCALGRAALAWRQAHPADPRLPQLLERALGRGEAGPSTELARLVGVPWGTGFEVSTPRDATRSLLQALRDEPQGRLADHLGGPATPIAVRSLPFHVAWCGLDTRDGGGAVTSNAVVFTRRGPVAISVHAGPYSRPGLQEQLLARVARAALKRLAPDLDRAPELGADQLRGFRGAALTDKQAAAQHGDDPSLVRNRTRFEPGEEAAVTLALLSDVARRSAIRWTLPDESRRFERRVLPARRETKHRWVLPLSRPGEYRVELAIDGAIVLDKTFRVHRTLR